MGVQFTSFPLFVIYDRSPRQAITTTYVNIQPYDVGSQTSMYDGSLTTNYEVKADYGNLVTGTIQVDIDYGQLFFNCQLSTKTNFSCGGGGGVQSDMWYSADGITYTNLFSVNVGISGSNDYIASNTLLAVRYVRYKMVRAAGAAGNSSLKIYQLRLMGSGN